MFSENQSHADDRLIRRYIDEAFQPEEFEAFQQRLTHDADFRRRYVELIELETRLHEAFEVIQSPLIKSRQHAHFVAGRWRWGVLIGLSLCLGFTLLFYELDIDKAPENSETLNQDATRSSYVTYQNPLKTDCAVIVSGDGIDSPDLSVGNRLQSGLMTLTSGRIQLEFFCGAKVALLGPCQIELQSDRSAKLLKGCVTAYLPERAAGFVINSPQATVLDLGTEFNMAVSEDGHSDIAVVNGLVDLSAIGEDGNTIRTRRLHQEQIVRVDNKRQMSEQTSITTTAFPEIDPPSIPTLKVGDDYVAAVINSLPDVYWRFKTSAGPSVKNEMSDRYHGRVVFSEHEQSVLTVSNYVRFSKSVLPRYIICDDAIKNLNLGSFSVEMWICPDDLAHSTCFSTIPTTSEDGRRMMNLIDVATNTWMIHDPGSFRFLHRYPPHLEHPEGYNVFTRGVCAPSQWQHIVAVRSEDRIEIYHNGRKYGSVEIGDQSGEGDFRILLGQLNLIWTHRQFNGAMDEFAFYTRSLSAEEIANHYRLISEPSLTLNSR